MAISAIPKNFRDGTIQFKDDTGSPITITIQYEPGDFQIDGLAEGLTDVVALLDRGTWFAWRKTNQHPLTGSFSAILTDLSDNTNKTIYDLAMKGGAFTGGVSTTSTKGDAWTTDLYFTIEGTDFSDSADHTLVIADCHITVSISEGDPDMFKVSFQTYAVPVAA